MKEAATALGFMAAVVAAMFLIYKLYMISYSGVNPFQ